MFKRIRMKAEENISDHELLQLLRQNSADGFVKVYNHFWPSLFDAAYKRLHDKSACEDILQNVFTDLWFRKDKVVISNLGAYLHTAVRYQVYKKSLQLQPGADFFKLLENAIESSFSPDDQLYTKELAGLVELWIKALPRKRRRIFLMHYNESLSTQEIATRLNISQKTVQNQLNTATIEIKSRLSHLSTFAILLTLIK